MITEPIKIHAVGDVMLGEGPYYLDRGVRRAIREHGPQFPLERVADVLEEFPDLAIRKPAEADAPRQAKLDLKVRLSAQEGRLMEVLDGEPLAVDELAARAGLEAAQASGALTLLELKGLVRSLPGGRFARRER